MTRPALSGAGGDVSPGHILFSAGDDPPPKRTVQGQRRRPGSSSPSQGRADAPQRDSRPPSQPPPSSGSGGGFVPPTTGGTGGGGYVPPQNPQPTGGGYMPTGGGGGGGLPLPLLLGGGVILLLVFGAVFLFGGLFGGGDGGSQGPVVENLPQEQLPQGNTGQLPGLDNSSGGQALPGGTIFGQGGTLDNGTGGYSPDLGPSFTGVAVDPPVIEDATFNTSGGLETAPASVASGDQTWTIMLYQDADDKVLEQDIFIDFNEAERVGSSDRVNIVAQLDRYRGGFSGDGDWDDTRRFLLRQDNDLNRIASPYESIGEVDMSDPNTLVDFATWAITNYPADKYVLIMSDHGMGWPGGWTDPMPPGGAGGQGIPLGRAIGDAMYLQDIDSALGVIRDRTGVDALEIVGMDACLMGHAEVFAALAPHARYAVASQEVEPAVGWAYTSFLGDLVQNPNMDGAELSRRIVDSYIVADQRVIDPQARAEFVGARAPSAEALAAQLATGVTLAAADLSAMPAVIEALDDFALTIQNVDQRSVAQARNYAQSFTSIFGTSVPPSYIDLAHFAAVLTQETGDPAVRSATENLYGALDRLIVAEVSGQKRPGATGLSIYFPNSQLYGSPAAGPESYVPVSRRFAEASVWDEFLNFHYTGRPIADNQGTLSIPDRSTTITAPGAGTITVSPIRLSDRVAAPGQPVTMAADVDGDNIGYIYLFAGFYDRDSNSLYSADTDFIDSGDTREVGGVFYPEWGEGEFTLEFVWEPIVFALNDGTNQVQALLEPQSYGADPANAIYAVDGVYTFADGEQRYARLLMSDGEQFQVIGYLGDGVDSAPREILPSIGDQFTVLEKWLDLDANGSIVGSATEPGGTLTFGEEPIVWEVLDGPAGDYTIGFIVEDLDGNRVSSFTDVAVR
jgi:hypothetical protein